LTAQDERSRLLAAVPAALSERTYTSLVVRHLTAVAGVSEETFFEHFLDRQECVREAYDDIFERFVAAIRAACDGHASWTDKLAAATRAVLAFVVDDPDEARLLLPETLCADPELDARVRASNECLIQLLRQGRKQSTRAAALPPFAERALLGGVIWVVGGRLGRGNPSGLPDMEHELVQLMLIPYAGREQAGLMASQLSHGAAEGPSGVGQTAPLY
jgi:AcrR family transcriptional regulator